MAKRAGNVNGEQKNLLIEFVKSHPKLVEGKFTKDFSFKDCQRLWIDATNILNSVPNGGFKNWKQWRKVWQDLKSKTKGKKALINKHRNQTGGGTLLDDDLDNNDSSILEIISNTAVEGIENIMETTVPLFTEKEPEENDVLEEIKNMDPIYNDCPSKQDENDNTSTIENASTSKEALTVNKENHNPGPVIRPSRMVREIYPEVEQGISGSNQSQACIVGDMLYLSGKIIPSESPCLKCSCILGEVRCKAEVCSTVRGCRAVALPGSCCPIYQCECLHQGKTYANGERLPQSPGQECSVCYCRGGHVQCAEVGCYTRSDCEPKYVEGECCPKYDNCPTRDASSNPLITVSATSLLGLDADYLPSWYITGENTSPFPPGFESVSSEEASGDDDIVMNDDFQRVSTPGTFSIKEITSNEKREKSNENFQILNVNISTQAEILNHQITIQEITPSRSEFIIPQSESVSASSIAPVTYNLLDSPEKLAHAKTQEKFLKISQKKILDQDNLFVQETRNMIASSTSSSTLLDSVDGLGTESNTNKKTEIYDRSPPVLRIGDQLLFIKQGQLVPEKDTSTPTPVITLIGAEGLQIGLGSREVTDHEIESLKNKEVRSDSTPLEVSQNSLQTIEVKTTSSVLIKNISSYENIESIKNFPEQNNKSVEVVTNHTPFDNNMKEISSTKSSKSSKFEIEQREYTSKENPYYPTIPDDLMILEQNESTTVNSASSIEDISSNETKVITPTGESELTRSSTINPSHLKDISEDSPDTEIVEENMENNRTIIIQDKNETLPNILKLRNHATVVNSTNQEWMKNEPTRIKIPLINKKAALPDSVVAMVAASDFEIEDDEEDITNNTRSSTPLSNFNVVPDKLSSMSSDWITIASVNNFSHIMTSKTRISEAGDDSDRKLVNEEISKETLEFEGDVFGSKEFTTVAPQDPSFTSNEDASIEVIHNDSVPFDTSDLVEIIAGFEIVTEKILSRTNDDHSKTVQVHSPKDDVEMININDRKYGQSHEEIRSHEEKRKRDVVKKVLKDVFVNPKENIRTDLEETTNIPIELVIDNEEQNIVRPLLIKTLNSTRKVTSSNDMNLESASNFKSIMADKSQLKIGSASNISQRHENSKVSD